MNIYTEGNTHVAGAIIAALNDNLKLDTGTLSYENLIGKTTSSSTSAGVDWTYSPKQKGDGKGEKVTSNIPGSQNPQPGQSAQSEEQKAAEQKRLEEEKKENAQDEKYKNVPKWLGNIFKVEDDAKDWWNAQKVNRLYGIAPGKISHTEKETTQTAYATIGKGEIIVRDNPGQSLTGLNRDPSQAMKTEQTTDVNIDLKPAFSYVDELLNGWGWPANITGAFNFFADPRAFLNDMQDNLAKSIPWLKRPTSKENPAPSAADAPHTASSAPGPQAAPQY